MNIAHPINTKHENELPPGFLGGLTLAGWRQANGTIKAHTGQRTLSDWPKEVTVGNTTFTLENVIRCENGFENAEYA